jgi:hypothetical protein
LRPRADVTRTFAAGAGAPALARHRCEWVRLHDARDLRGGRLAAACAGRRPTDQLSGRGWDRTNLIPKTHVATFRRNHRSRPQFAHLHADGPTTTRHSQQARRWSIAGQPAGPTRSGGHDRAASRRTRTARRTRGRRRAQMQGADRRGSDRRSATDTRPARTPPPPAPMCEPRAARKRLLLNSSAGPGRATTQAPSRRLLSPRFWRTEDRRPAPPRPR